MFKHLRTSTKLILLCAMFIISLGVTTYSLVAEKQIAITFARKELVGTSYLTVVRGIFAAVLTGPPIAATAAPPYRQSDEFLRTLAVAEDNAGATLQTVEPAVALAGALHLWSSNREGTAADAFALDAVAKAQQLAARIADDSNLALDPDLDSYYAQELVTRKLPAFLRQLSEVQVLSRAAAAPQSPSNEQKARFQILGGVLRSIVDEANGNLAAAYRGNPDGSLKQAVAGSFAAMMSHTDAYLRELNARFVDSNPDNRGAAASDHLYDALVDSAIGAWSSVQSELDRLLLKRIDALLDRMRLSLGLTGALAGLSIIIAVMTHRHIVRPLERLEHVASTMSETKDYNLRIDYTSTNEIGRLTTAFNNMLSELAAARERERSEQSELARAARLTTMGAMTASIAHEINQPLAAIVTSSNAAQRWLARAQPDLDEARASLARIAGDADRASQVIGSVRAMFKKDGQAKTQLAVNNVIEDILALVHGEIQKQQVSVRTELLTDLPHVVGDRTQLQQVLLNLIMNAVEAMNAISDRERLLVIKSGVDDSGTVMVTVADTGTGIDAKDIERIFDAFFTTKSDGMGMGLSICRSIVEAHGGRLWASPGASHGSVFHVALPSDAR